MAPVKLSVIVPVYNALSFVANCLDSVLAQGLPNMEILCIDDGSTDGSAAILDDYAARHPALCRVEHRANGGASVARNAGLDACRGQYIAFVDADDWIAPDFLGRLLDLALRHDLDMAHGNGIFHFEGRQADYPIYALDLPPDVMPGREAMRRRLGKRAFLHYPVLQVYRRAFVERVGLRFIPGRLHEDVLWTTQAFLQADSVAYDGQPGYFYRRQPRTAPATAEGRDAALRDQIESAAANAVGLSELMATIAGDAELHRLMGWQVVDGALSIFHMLPRIAAPGLKRQVYRQLRATGFFGLLWRHAVDAAQRRRIAKTWLRSWFS
ncbi:MAG: glycosyltransferase [Rhodocyclales bacterium]|nr:glycosyltransferase [Rhodocyclales bacterium]